MPRTVTVGLDGTPASLAAAEWAAREALLRELPLRLVHAWPWQPYLYSPLTGVHAPPPESDVRRRQQWAERMPREAAETLAQRHPGLRITVDQVDEQPVTALLEAAHDAHPLVLGSHGLSALGGYLVGSVAFGVLARTERPVVLVRAGSAAGGERRTASAESLRRSVVLGLDLRTPADALIEYAFDAAARRAANLRVVHAWHLLPYCVRGATVGPGATAGLAMTKQRLLTEILMTWREKFPGVDVCPQALLGKVGSHLVNAARDAELVVVGRGSHSSSGPRIGPVTHAVLQHAQAPVAVVPHA
ncbi:universal stress protein [Streptomyces tauricus]|uniref:universal stress protein n=1 Tax=Streptomyces tauricus TaxID=68274 RepID=UPI00387F2E3D